MNMSPTTNAGGAGPAVASAQNNRWRVFTKTPAIAISALIILFLIVVSWVGPYLLPFKDTTIDIAARFQPPLTGAHVFGTDPLGRDMFARLLMAGRISLMVGLMAALVCTAIGMVVGSVAGFYGRWIGGSIMRFIDAMLCFPTLFLLLTLAAFISPGLLTIAVIIGLSSWMEVARIVEGQFRSLREREFVSAAKSVGSSDRFIIFVEILPNVVPSLMAAASLIVARAILLESYVSFLGYGIQPPTPSWGNMLNDAQQYMESAPWLAIVPGLAITIAVTSFSFLGDGLRSAFDPTDRSI